MNKTLLRLLCALPLAVSTSAFAQSPPRHLVELQLEPASGVIEIADRVELEGRDSYRFELAPWLDIEDLRLDGGPLKARRDKASWIVVLPDREPHRLEFNLRGVVPAREQSAEMRSSSGADGVYLPGYDAWLPLSAGTVSYRLRVKVPQAQRAVATGKLVEETGDDNYYQAVFASTQPMEPPSLFAGPYQVTERVSDGLRLRTYFHEELASLADTYLDTSAAYIRRYSESIGDYPYADFHVVSAPLAVGLGFPNLAYVGRRVLPLPFMRGRSLAHEILHNWWGNGVAVDYASGNWAEGLTTYMADYALQRDRGKAAARGMRIKWLRDYAALPPERDRPVREFTSKSHQAAQVIGYNKAAFIFHMLHQEIGAGNFEQGLRLFWQQHKYGVAGWAELEAAFERVAGRDLGWFFNQWLDRRGAPRVSLGAHSLSQVEDGYVIRVEILQPVSGYRLRLPVLLKTADGREFHEITIDEALTWIEWKTSTKPEFIHFDPDSDLFRRLQRNEAPPILRDITLDADTVTTIVTEDEEFAGLARGLAAALMDVEPHFQALADITGADQAMLLITTNARLPSLLESLQLRRPVGLPSGVYTAAAWTTRLGNGNPVLVISADDAAALRTLMRPLPHYGGQSYVLFAGGRAVERGIWPVDRGPLYLDFSGN